VENQEPSAGLPRLLRLGPRPAHQWDLTVLEAEELGDYPPHVSHDLDHCPWPFPDDHFEEILVDGALADLRDITSSREEMYRIC